jgi:hypothetical protein
MTGINYPWTTVGGKPNYGCDFGVNVWGGHAGVTSHADEVRADFEALSTIGVEVVRWFVFTDGRGGVRWDPTQGLTGLADGFFEDMDAALGFARDAGVQLCLVLFDYLWMIQRKEYDAAGRHLFTTRPEYLATSRGMARVVERLVDPILARYGTSGSHAALGHSIHSFDVINEPDWVTRGLATNRWRELTSRRRARTFSRAALRRFVGGVADRVHQTSRAKVTVGGGRVRDAGEWDNEAYGLDFVQLHSYPDVRHPRRDRSLVGLPCRSLGLSKPVLIGEFPGNGDRQHPPDHVPPPVSLMDYLNHAREGGYLGAWPWSFKGVDEFGAVDADAMRAWIARGGSPAATAGAAPVPV